MNARQAKVFTIRLNSIKKNIAAERDKLRSLKEDLNAIEESSERASDLLEEAGDTLSEYL